MALILLTACIAMQAQVSISGTVTDRDTKEGIEQVTVQLLRGDSTFVKGTLTNESGAFSIDNVDDGRYIVKLSSVGYQPYCKDVRVKGVKTIDLGTLVMGADAIMLKATTVTAQAQKVILREDTFVYNADAYRTPEGSVVEELVKKLPGATVDESGKITINGKEVKKILVDGKEFMTGDTKTAMKNLPTSIIQSIKAYDEKSDMARVTGVDDGEEETVLDFGIKRGMNKGLMMNADVAAGTKHRYAERLMVGVMKDDLKVMGFGNANNTNDQGFPGGGGGGRFGAGKNGLNSSKMLGVNIGYEKKNKLEINGNVRWNHNDGDIYSFQATKNFVGGDVTSHSNSLNQKYSRGNQWNSRFKIEWKPDTMTNILFRPSFSYSSNDGNDGQDSKTWDAVDILNSKLSRSTTYSDSKNLGGMLQINRKLNTKGRNVTLRTEANYSDGDSKNLATNNVHLYQILDRFGNDSTYQTNRYNVTPTKSWNYSVQATYTEPLAKKLFLQLSYKYTYKYNKSDRTTYAFNDLGEHFFDGISMDYRNWDAYLSRLANPLPTYEDTKLSRFSEYKNYIHDLQATLRWVHPKYLLNVGVLLQPQKTAFRQRYMGTNVETDRTVTNFTPTLDFRYTFSKVSKLRINYRGVTTQPNMSDLVDIIDDSDPLNITRGNPGLKPSFTNNLRFYYNTYMEKHQRSLMTYLNFSNTRNAISNRVVYDAATGGRISQPDNVNGNWQVDAALMFNTPVDSAGYWNVNTFTQGGYNNYVGYVSVNSMSLSERNTTRTFNLSERLQTSYRRDWYEVALDGSFNYMTVRNLLQSQNNQNTWQFSYGGSLNFYMPWGTSLSTDMHMNSRRGYSDTSMNTNELVWNAQVSQSFLKGKALTISLQFYDILQRQSTLSRTVNAMMQSDTSYNSITSYAMLHAVYRFNAFGGKGGRSGRSGRGERMGDGRGGFGGGYGGGGYGGGRPPRF